MVRMVSDTPVKSNAGTRSIKFKYDSKSVDDKKILEGIMDLLKTQKRCDNCINYRVEGHFCGYAAHYCVIHGNIETFSHPHHDGDGSKCEDYVREKVE